MVSISKTKNFYFGAPPSGKVIEAAMGMELLSLSVRRMEDIWQSSG